MTDGPLIGVEGVEGAIVLALGTFRPTDVEATHALVRRFRAGEADAFLQVASAARAAIECDPDLRRQQVIVVPVPGHVAGAVAGPGLALAGELARAFGWDLPAPVPLRRVAAVPSAKERGPRDPEVEEASLAWDESGLRPGATIVLLDDVVASGRTLEACVSAIRRDGSTRPVRVVAIARAILDPHR